MKKIILNSSNLQPKRFKTGDKVLAIWPGYTGSNFASFFYKGDILGEDGLHNYRINFEGHEAIINERFVLIDGDVRPATEEETRNFIRHSGFTPGCKQTVEKSEREPRALKKIKSRLVLKYNQLLIKIIYKIYHFIKYIVNIYNLLLKYLIYMFYIIIL
jgi:hypothetical protein